MTRTLAAIPAFNEEVTIGSVVLQCRSHVDEVLVVDDGSEDRTSQIARDANAVVYRYPSNRGKGAAIQLALEYARNKAYDAMVLLDADGQHDAANIPLLMAPVLDGRADVVVGTRNHGTTRMPLYRRAGKGVLDFLTAFGGLDAVRDSQSGFRALSRKAILSLTLEERGFGVESEMLIEAKSLGLRVADVPIRVRYDLDGSTKGPLAHGVGVVDRLLRIIAVRHPLLFFGVPGATAFVIGLWFGFDTVELYNETRSFFIGKALLSLIFLMLGALSLFAAIILNVMPKAIARAEADRQRQLDHGSPERK